MNIFQKMFSKTKRDSTMEIENILYKIALESVTEELKAKKKTIEELEKQTVNLRDELATRIFMEQYKEGADLRVAVKEAYREADMFLRVREDNDDNLVNLINEYSNDCDLGREIRKLILNKESDEPKK